MTSESQPGPTSFRSDRFKSSFTIKHSQPLIDALQASSQLSRSELKRALKNGAVRLHRQGYSKRRIRKASFSVHPGDVVLLCYDKALLRKTADTPVSIRHHSDYSIWYKPPGMVTQGTCYGDHLSLLRIVEQHLGLHNRIFPVHRLDREARGLVMLAHSKKSCEALSRQFREKTIEKKYWAKVVGAMVPEGTCFEINQPLDGKNSITSITIGRYCRETETTAIFINLKTGRYHQIRRHLAAINYPLVGDRKYGFTGRTDEGLQLCAYQLSYKEPKNKNRQLITLPPDLLPF
ncbi:MAG: RluA family pseudouridine synthase [Desulfocapsaceae bacterium]|jgi:tRNA pseudouridine32 synthase/23S rRNA pseudouridine746 synthase|nr:RluA family pseudouridine synthase [Desulfocapsaceae bacterium]